MQRWLFGGLTLLGALCVATPTLVATQRRADTPSALPDVSQIVLRDVAGAEDEGPPTLTREPTRRSLGFSAALGTRERPTGSASRRRTACRCSPGTSWPVRSGCFRRTGSRDAPRSGGCRDTGRSPTSLFAPVGWTIPISTRGSDSPMSPRPYPAACASSRLTPGCPPLAVG
jgi:hypothetical protein